MNFKFEHSSYFTILAVLTASLFIFRDNPELVNLILGAFIGAFTKGNLDKRGDNNNG